MSIEAPLSKYKKHNLLITIAVLAGLAVWFAYDGWWNQEFIKKHTKPDGTPESTLTFNKYSPPFMLMGAAWAGIWYWLNKDKKIIADEQGLRCNKLSIPYDRIESIDKTHFDSKGFFIVHYKDNQQQLKPIKLEDRVYDNLPAILDHLITKISE